MNDPHVVELIYLLEHDRTVDYSDVPPADFDNDRFKIGIKDKMVTFYLKEHYASEAEARAVVDPFVREWELDAALTGRPGDFSLSFMDAKLVDRNPTPGVIEASLTIRSGAPRASILATVGKLSYPAPPLVPKLEPDDPEVQSMFIRYARYCDGREPLLSMANFCLTMLERRLAKGRGAAAQQYGIAGMVLKKFGDLVANKGGPDTARKANPRFEELKTEEKRFLEAVVKIMIRRVAEVAHSGSPPTDQITMAHLPTLPS